MGWQDLKPNCLARNTEMTSWKEQGDVYNK